MSEENKEKRSGLSSVMRVFAILVLIVVCAYFFVIRPGQTEMQMKLKRAEVPVNLKIIKSMLEYHKESSGKYISIEAYPKTTSTTPQDWIESESGGFEKISFVPMTYAYGSYWVEAAEDDFAVYGISDIDGDGVYATYKATKSMNPTLLTKDVY